MYLHHLPSHHSRPQYNFKSFTEISNIELPQGATGFSSNVYVDVIAVVVDVGTVTSIVTRNEQKGQPDVASSFLPPLPSFNPLPALTALFS